MLFFFLLWSCSSILAENRKVRVGVYNNPPLISFNEQGEPSGFVIDLLDHVAQIEGWELVYVPDLWEENLKAVKEGRNDLQPAISDSEERKQYLSFSREDILLNWGVVYTANHLEVNSYIDLNDLRVAVVRNSITQNLFRNILDEFDVSVEFIWADNIKQQLQMVEKGVVDAAITGRLSVEMIVERYAVQKTPLVFGVFSTRFATKKGHNTELLKKLDEHISRMKKNKDSVFYEARERWLFPIREREIGQGIKIMLIALPLLIIILLVNLYLFNRELHRRTRDLQDEVKRRIDISEELKKMSLVVEKGPMSILITDAEGVIEYANPQAYKNSGYNPGELKGKKAGIFKSDEHPKEYFARMWKTIRMGNSWSGEVKNRRSDGTYVWEELSITPVFDPSGKIRHYIALKEDITIRKRMINALRRSETLFRAVVEGSKDAIVVINKSAVICIFNKAAEEMFGWSRADMLNRNLDPLLPPGFQVEHRALLESYFSTGKPDNALGVTVELEACRKNGESFPIDLTLSKASVTDDPLIIAMVRDITVRKDMMAELTEHRTHLEEVVARQTQELVQSRDDAMAANKSKSMFLANMSHELRTPIHGINSYARFGIKKSMKEEPEVLKGYFEKIQKSATRLTLLLNDILDLSKLEAGKMVYDFKEVHLNILIRDNCTAYREPSEEKGIYLKMNLPSTKVLCKCDGGRISQVIGNLLSNAVKFSPKEGLVTVSLEEVCVNRNGKMKNMARVSVEDQGFGIPEDELEKVFDKFEQSSKTRSGAGGTGLGLAICKEIIEFHDGMIWAGNREDGVGAILEFYLEIYESAGVGKTEALKS